MRTYERDDDFLRCQPVRPELGDGSVTLTPFISERTGFESETGQSLTLNFIEAFRLQTSKDELSVSEVIDLMGAVEDCGNVFEYVDNDKVPGISIRQCISSADFDTILSPLEESYKEINRLVDVNGLLDDIYETKTYNQTDKRVEIIKNIFEVFKNSNPSANLDRDEPGSLYWTERFIDYYAKEMAAMVKQEQLELSVETWRQNFDAALQSPALKRLLTKENRFHLAEIGSTTPVIITDPLNTLLKKRNPESGEIYGFFQRDTRTVTIDPFTVSYIEGRIANSRQLLTNNPTSETFTDELISLKLRHTLFHELVHAATGDYYHDITRADYDYTSKGEVRSEVTIREFGSFWTRAWNEAMTEKLAYLMTAELTQDITSMPKSMGEIEDDIYLYESNNPRKIGSSPKSRSLSEVAVPHYPEYRLLVDSFFDRLDWEKAGLTRLQAEKLAFNAFVEPQKLPGEDRKPDSHRLKFVQSINLAGHTGFMMKFNTLTNMYGVKLMTDILVDPDFDPADPKSLPWFGSYEESQISERRISRYEFNREAALSMVRDDPEFGQKRLDIIEAEYRRAASFKLAKVGLRRILEARHPERKAIAANTRLHLAIFGSKAMNFPQLVPRPPFRLEEAHADIEYWRNLNTKSQ